MTKRKHLKRRVRERSAKTGESYTAALRHLRAREESTSMATTNSPTFTVNCSFCSKTHQQVRKLIAGPGVYICNECVALCDQIIEDEGTTPSPQPPPPIEAWPVERLVSMFTNMWGTSRQLEARLTSWAQTLHARGVTAEAIAKAIGIPEAEAAERFGL